MIILIARLILSLLANAVGLFVTSLLVEGFSINGVEFVSAVLIFSVATTILGPLIMKISLTHANFLVGGISLITILIGLIITNIVSDGIEIEGLSNWIVASLLVWIFSIIGNLLLPLIIFKKTLKKHKENKS